MDNTAETTSEQPAKKRSGRLFFIILIVLLALGNGLLYYYNQQSKIEKDTIATKLESAEKLKAQLEQDYKKILEDLEQYKGENAQLDSLVNVQAAEMEQLKARIETLLRKGGGISSSELAQARKELDELRRMSQKYQAQIDSLRTENTRLTAANYPSSIKNLHCG